MNDFQLLSFFLRWMTKRDSTSLFIIYPFGWSWRHQSIEKWSISFKFIHGNTNPTQNNPSLKAKRKDKILMQSKMDFSLGRVHFHDVWYKDDVEWNEHRGKINNTLNFQFTTCKLEWNECLLFVYAQNVIDFSVDHIRVINVSKSAVAEEWWEDILKFPYSKKRKRKAKSGYRGSWVKKGSFYLPHIIRYDLRLKSE